MPVAPDATFCGTCDKVGERALNPRGGGVAVVPVGWYMVTVGTGFAKSRNGKAYRYLGLYCSIDCLERKIPEWASVEARYRSTQ
jgi:hypothetical protein